MKNVHMILSAASMIPLLSSCASYQKTADSAEWSIKPAFNVRHSTETPDAYYQLGRYYQGQNRYGQALVAYQKALAIDGTFAEALNGLGVIYSMQGKHQEAIGQFRLAVKQAPNVAHIHNNLGYALYLSKSYAEAVSALERAVALEPSNQSARTNLALALGKAGDRQKAVQVMAEVAKPQFVENVPPVNEEVQQVQASAPTPVDTAPAIATTAIPAPVPHQTLALPKDWGVITQPVRKPVPLVESRIQVVQLASNVYELRERAEIEVQSVSASKPLQQASAQKPNLAAEISAQVAQPVFQQVAEQQAQAVAPTAKPYRIEVSNGNGVTGLAKKVAGFLDGKGYSKARLTNQQSFQVASSQVQYRSGYQKQAQSLAWTLPGQPSIAQADSMRMDISIRVVLGKDMADNVAYFQESHGKIRIARLESDL